MQQTDAKSQVATFTYDKLGRPLTRSEADLASTWTYDSAANGVGKPATAGATGTVSGGGSSRTFTYDGSSTLRF